MYRRVTLGFAALLWVAVFGASSCMWSDPESSPNIVPVINSFTIEGEAVESLRLREGDRPSITVVAWDGNGDEMGEDSFTWEAELGTIDGFGPSIRYEPPANIVWENPPQELIDTITVTITDGQPGSEPVSETLEVEIAPPCEASNQAPIIHSVEASPLSIDLGDRTTVTVDAEDPEGEALTYEWTPAFGYMEGTGPVADWVTTDVCCLAWYSVEVVVSDGCATSWSYVEVEVKP